MYRWQVSVNISKKKKGIAGGAKSLRRRGMILLTKIKKINNEQILKMTDVILNEQEIIRKYNKVMRYDQSDLLIIVPYHTFNDFFITKNN